MVSRVLHADVDKQRISVSSDLAYFKHLFFVFAYTYYVITISLLNSTIKLNFFAFVYNGCLWEPTGIKPYL